MDDGFLRDGQVDAHGVDNQIIRGGAQPLNGALHGQARSLQDVEMVDLEWIGRRDRPGKRPFLDALGKDIAPLGWKLFAVRQSANRTVRRKDHRGGKDGAEEAPASRLVNARNSRVSALAGGALVGTAAWNRLRQTVAGPKPVYRSRSRRRAALPLSPRK